MEHRPDLVMTAKEVKFYCEVCHKAQTVKTDRNRMRLGKWNDTNYADIVCNTCDYIIAIISVDDTYANLLVSVTSLLEALKALEWVDRIEATAICGVYYCPWCKGVRPNHKDHCIRQAAIAKAKGKNNE